MAIKNNPYLALKICTDICLWTLFLKAYNFPQVTLSENCSLLGTDDVFRQLSELIIHQIFLLLCNNKHSSLHLVQKHKR